MTDTPKPSPGKILVADDSPNIREILQMSLEAAGYEVVLAKNGEQAMQLFQKEKPDLLIVDVMMPKANGFQICRKVKTSMETQSIPVILLTAKSQDEDIYWGKDCGADEYITKPFSTRELEQTIARLLKHRREQGPAVSDAGIAAEVKRRQEKGEPGQVIHLEWDPRIMDVYRKKYGEFKFAEAMRAVRHETEKFLEEHKDRGPVALHESSGLSLVLRGTPEEATLQAGALATRLTTFAASLYDAEDRTRGFIAYRDPRLTQEQKLPLLSFTPRIAAGIAA